MRWVQGDPGLEAALARLPHGSTFRFVDRMLELEPGVEGVGEFELRPDAGYLSGHFPGEPLMPGVLILEAAAQVAGVVAQSDPGPEPLRGLRLAAVRGVKWVGPVLPGDRLELIARVTARMGGVIQASVEARVGGTVVMRGEVTLAGR